MAESQAFDRVCIMLEHLTELNRLEARGTVRIALKEAGLRSDSVRPEEMAVAVGAILVGELESRGIEDAPGLCEKISESVSRIDDDAQHESPEDIFARLGR